LAVAHDFAQESHTSQTGPVSANEASFTWSHAGAASGVRGVLVFVMNLSANADIVTSVTYGGVTVPIVSGGGAVDTATELIRCQAYFLGSSVPQGTQSVVVNRTNNANNLYAVSVTVTAGDNTAVTGIVLAQENQAITQKNVDDGSPGTNSVRYAGLASGLNSVPPIGAQSTLLFDVDIGNQTASAVRETTAGQGSRPVGFNSGTSDDTAAVHLAVKETALVNADAEVSWAEFEVPTADSRADVSWAEFEVPTADSRADVSWAEFEVPTADSRADVSWAEFEVPNLVVNADAEVSWTEFEVPTADSRADVSWAEFEVPSLDASAEISWAEFEVPLANSRADVSWTEFQVPSPVVSQVFASGSVTGIPDAAGLDINLSNASWTQETGTVNHYIGAATFDPPTLGDSRATYVVRVYLASDIVGEAVLLQPPADEWAEAVVVQIDFTRLDRPDWSAYTMTETEEERTFTAKVFAYGGTRATLTVSVDIYSVQHL